MHKSTLTEDRLRAAESICALFVQLGTTRIPAARLAQEAEISIRTYHRYFSTRAETVEPLFSLNSRRLNDFVTDAPAPDARTLLLGAHELMFGGAVAARTAALFPVIFDDPETWAVFLRALHDGELSVEPHLALRLGLVPASAESSAVAAAFAASNRIALEEMVHRGADRSTVFARMIDAYLPILGSAVLTP